MIRWKPIAVVLGAVILGGSAVQADPWKDESGKGKAGDRQRFHVQPFDGLANQGPYPPPGYGYVQPIPPGHLPPPGECRIWYQGVPPGQQPPPFRC